MTLSREEFENLTQQVFDALPDLFQQNMENVRIVVEDEPTHETLRKVGLHSSASLLGLYEGVPLNKRGAWYGMYAVVPDKISLYKRNIERGAESIEELTDRIRSVLIHEVAHYYGMSETEVREAGY